MNDENESLVFVLMPFQQQFNELFDNCIKLAAKRAGAYAERVDKQIYKDADVLERIRNQIDKAAVLVAVTSGNKPNVFYEIGLAHALRKHVIILTNNTKTIPYDLKHFPSLEYKKVDDALVNKLTEELKWHISHPTVGDRYYQEFKAAFKEVESFSEKLTLFFLPITKRCLLEWSDFVRSVVTDGILMQGPERLEITRCITLETKKYMLIEQIIANPTEIHSRDWIEFYTQIGKQDDIGKTWLLFKEMDEVKQKNANVEATWRFFTERNFTALYCSPTEFRRATGKKPPEYQVIEYFGEYIKLLVLNESSYTSGEQANTLFTTIRASNSLDQRMLESVMNCAYSIDREWIDNLCKSVNQNINT